MTVTDAEAEINALSQDDRVYMAQLVLEGWRFVPGHGDLFLAYLPNNEPMYVGQSNGGRLKQQLQHARHYQTNGKRWKL